MEPFGVEKYFGVSPLTAISTLMVVFLGILYYAFKDKEVLPGPRGLPFFGYWPFLRDETAHLQLQKKMEKYGDVFSFTSFGQLYIHLGSIQAVKEAHVTKSECFNHRDTSYNALIILFSEGIACVNGEAWKTMRKFIMQAFRELGLSSMKDYMAGPVYDCVKAAVDDLMATGGKPVTLTNNLGVRCTAILRRMLFNDDGITEEELNDFTEAYGKTLTLLSPTRFLLRGEFARRFIYPLYSDHKIVLKNRKAMVDILRRVIKRHEEQFDEGNIRDIIDRYIKERNDRRKNNDATFQYFTENGLISTLIEIMGDGTFSVAILVSYFLLALLEHPEEQEKIYKELEEVVGHERQPTLEDKSKLSYTNAFLLEVQRMMELFFIFPTLQCTQETTLTGHIIPKGAITVVNFWTCHRDPKVFDNPHEFRPSRFLSESGKPKQELPIFFGVGKRSCAGESFVMMQAFLFLTTIVNNFRLTTAKEYEKKAFVDINAIEICAHPRK